MWQKRGRFESNAVTSGYIGSYGLSDWWLQTFSPEERALMEARYTPMGGGATLTRGNAGSGEDLVKFLTYLAGWFRRTDQVHIALRILDRARSEPMTPTREHFFLLTFIDVRYKQRATDESAVEDVAAACERLIEIAPSVIEDMKAEHERMEDEAAAIYAKIGERYRRTPFPGVGNSPAFSRLIAIRKKQGRVDEAKRLKELYHSVWEIHTIDYRRSEQRA